MHQWAWLMFCTQRHKNKSDLVYQALQPNLIWQQCIWFMPDLFPTNYLFPAYTIINSRYDNRIIVNIHWVHTIAHHFLQASDFIWHLLQFASIGGFKWVRGMRFFPLFGVSVYVWLFGDFDGFARKFALMSCERCHCLCLRLRLSSLSYYYIIVADEYRILEKCTLWRVQMLLA